MTVRTLRHVDDIAPDTTENVSSMTSNGSAVVAFSINVTGLVAEDLVLLIGQFEVTNNQAYNVGITRSLIRATSSSATTGTPVVPAVQENVTPDTHHMAAQIIGIDTGMSGSQYYNLVLQAGASGGNGSIVVEQGYGRLQAVVLKR